MFTGYMYNRGYTLYFFICDLAQNQSNDLMNSSISLTIFAQSYNDKWYTFKKCYSGKAADLKTIYRQFV